MSATSYRKRTVITQCLGTTLEWDFDLAEDLCDSTVVEVRAFARGVELLQSDPVYDVLNALIEREPHNPLGALDALERELEDRRVIAQESRALGMEASC